MKKFSSFLIVLLLMLASFTAGVQYPRGDVDYNGKVNIADVVTLIDYLLTGTWEEEPVAPPDDHEWVDLGLPSGTLWATCNIGASTPEDYGDYFAWGETEPKEVYDWSTYKLCNGSYNTLTKYCTDSTYGTVDNKTELEPEDDAAYVNWGALWRMPTLEQLQELVHNSTCTWTTRNGVNGILFTGANDNKLFFPAAGTMPCLFGNVGTYISYWSRVSTSGATMAFDMFFSTSGSVDWTNWTNSCTGRQLGLSVRAVRVLEN